MKKKILVIVVVLLLAMVLVACHPDSTPAPNEGTGGILPDTDVEDNVEEDIPPPTETPEEDATPDKPSEIIPHTPLIMYDTFLVVTSRELNVREWMSGSSRVLGRLRRGDGIGLISRESSSWYKVHYKGKQAYISSSYVREVSIAKSTNNNIERIISEGKRLLGYPYVWGSQRYHWGNGVLNTNFRMGEFDCSALMQYMFYKGARIHLDVTTRSQVVQGRVVRDDLRRGDLMFFTNSARRYRHGIEKVGHVALYLGDNYILHTATDYALIEEISSERWNNYLVSKRFF